MTTAADGPQSTAADAYTHAASMAFSIAEKATVGRFGRRWVPVEYVEHLAAGLQARAEEAGK